MFVGEPVEVELSPEGAPVRFIWRGVRYGVVSTPEPWFSRKSWWQETSRAPRGGSNGFEREMWRVDAVPLQGTKQRLDGSFDLTRIGEDTWQLEQAWDDDLDMRLFA